MSCDKIRYKDKKNAKRAARGASSSVFGGQSAKFREYNCKFCNSWHIATTNRAKMRYNSQHSRGGRISRTGRGNRKWK